MKSAQILQTQRVASSYGFLLALAVGTAGIAGFSLYESLHPSGSGIPFWGLCAGAAAATATLLTAEATKRWQQMRGTPNARPSSRPSPQKPVAQSNSPALPAPRKLLALPAPTVRSDRIQETNMGPASNARTAEAHLDPERERLRRKGLTDQDITDIFKQREIGAPAGKSYGSGVATGILNNLEAILTHAKSLIPSFKADLEHMFDTTASKAIRVSGALALAVKVCALGVLGYYLYIESIEFRARAYKTWADACISRQQNAINHTPVFELLDPKKLDGDAECSSR